MLAFLFVLHVVVFAGFFSLGIFLSFLCGRARGCVMACMYACMDVLVAPS